MKKGIVIPCYNEANRLKFDEFENFLEQNPDYLICFVNDGSQDATLEQLQAFRVGKERQVSVCNLELNQGKAEAVRTGVNALLKYPIIENIGFLDADLATGFKDYKRLVNRLNDTKQEMVFGSRKMDGENEIERSLFRNLASRLIGMMIKIIVGMPIRDTQCGAKVFSRTLAEKVFQKSFLSRWLFDVEIFIRVNNLFKSSTMDKIKEVSLLSWEEIDGSKITLRDTLKFPVALFEIGYDYKLKPKILNINAQVRQLSIPVTTPAA